MASFKKNVTFSPTTVFIEPSENMVVPRLNPPWPTEFKSELWYSQRELAYMEYSEFRQKRAAMLEAAAAARNHVMPLGNNNNNNSSGSGSGSSSGSGSGPHSLGFK
jgi:hypothetical protein